MVLKMVITEGSLLVRNTSLLTGIDHTLHQTVVGIDFFLKFLPISLNSQRIDLWDNNYELRMMNYLGGIFWQQLSVEI